MQQVQLNPSLKLSDKASINHQKERLSRRNNLSSNKLLGTLNGTSTMSEQPDDEIFEQEMVIDIPLNLTGDGGSTYRTKNDPQNPWQRTNVTERKGAVDLRCTCLDIIHGDFEPDNDDAATLIVLEFNFDARKVARRIKFVKTTFQFSSFNPRDPEPEVFKISPVGNLVLVPTKQMEERRATTGGNLAAAPFPGVEAGLNISLEKNVSLETTDATRVVGSIDLRGRDYGKKNSVSWSLMENDTTKTGVPTLLRSAILLKRQHDEKFQCTCKIDAEMDFMSSIQQVVGSRPRDDPIFFDPTLDPTNNLQTYDTSALGSIDLSEISVLTFMTVQEGAVKHVS